MDDTLGNILSSRDYALCLSPGFFRFYAHTGVLHGLHQHGALRATHLSGSSAGAMVAGFYAAGLTPDEMVDAVLKVKRDDFWDLGGFGGLLRGGLFHQILDKHLPKKKFEDCAIPCAVTAFDCLRLRTTHIRDGCIATAIRAACTFPGLFQPVIVKLTPHIDGGVFDDIGLMALPGVPESNLIVNIIFEGSSHDYSKLPSKYHGSKLLTIIVKDIPMVSPFSMSDLGPVALSAAVKATMYALQTVKPVMIADNHWVVTIQEPPSNFYVGKIIADTLNNNNIKSKATAEKKPKGKTRARTATAICSKASDKEKKDQQGSKRGRTEVPTEKPKSPRRSKRQRN